MKLKKEKKGLGIVKKKIANYKILEVDKKNRRDCTPRRVETRTNKRVIKQKEDGRERKELESKWSRKMKEGKVNELREGEKEGERGRREGGEIGRKGKREERRGH